MCMHMQLSPHTQTVYVHITFSTLPAPLALFFSFWFPGQFYQRNHCQDLLPLGRGHSTTDHVAEPHPPPRGAATYPSTDSRGRIDHVNARRVRKDLSIADDMGYIDMALNAALLEGHVVLCKGARLVSEDVFHLRVPHTQVKPHLGR